MAHYKELGIDYPIGITAIIGPPRCGTSTLLQGLSMTVPFVRGFVFEDKNRSTDRFLNPTNDLTGFFELLRNHQDRLKSSNPDEPRPFRHIVIGGWPETEDQINSLIKFCPKFRLALINSYCHPMDPRDENSYEIAGKFANRHQKQFIRVECSRKIQYQAEQIVLGMDITPNETRSMRRAIFAKGSDAWTFFDGINCRKPGPTRMAPFEPHQSRPTSAIIPTLQIPPGMSQAAT